MGEHWVIQRHCPFGSLVHATPVSTSSQHQAIILLKIELLDPHGTNKI
jgi:hypothetical protein